MASTDIKAALIQHQSTPVREDMLACACSAIEKAAADGARLILLQELFTSPYFCQTENPDHFDLAEPVPGPTSDHLASLAARLGVVIVAPLFERRAPATPAITRNTISPPVTAISAPSPLPSANWGC